MKILAAIAFALLAVPALAQDIAFRSPDREREIIFYLDLQQQELSPNTFRMLDEAVQMATFLGTTRILMDGYPRRDTDDSGYWLPSDQENDEIWERKINQIADALFERGLVPDEIYLSFSGSQPSDRPRNLFRRIELGVR